ncbi:MAG: hypothetical protein HZA24_09445 [Nitrospirae bacterium]|nr:hypothetical protein [Nitrospirota bacterium]
MRHLLVAITTLLLLATPARANNDHLLPADHPLAAEVTAAAYRWLDAVGRRDVEGVTAFAFPEDADFVRKDLADPNGVLRWAFLSDGIEAYCMAQVPDPGVVLLMGGPVYSPTYGVTACFYDRARHHPTTDVERIQLGRFPQPEGVYCEDFVFVDGGWRFTYTSILENYIAPGVRVEGDPYR